MLWAGFKVYGIIYNGSKNSVYYAVVLFLSLSLEFPSPSDNLMSLKFGKIRLRMAWKVSTGQLLRYIY